MSNELNGFCPDRDDCDENCQECEFFQDSIEPTQQTTELTPAAQDYLDDTPLGQQYADGFDDGSIEL